MPFLGSEKLAVQPNGLKYKLRGRHSRPIARSSRGCHFLGSCPWSLDRPGSTAWVSQWVTLLIRHLTPLWATGTMSYSKSFWAFRHNSKYNWSRARQGPCPPGSNIVGLGGGRGGVERSTKQVNNKNFSKSNFS